MKNIVVLVSGGGTNLQALIDAEKRGEIRNGKITCVIASNFEAYALTRAKENGIATRVIPKKEYPDRGDYSREILKALQKEKENNSHYTNVGKELARTNPTEYRRIVHGKPKTIGSFFDSVLSFFTPDIVWQVPRLQQIEAEIEEERKKQEKLNNNDNYKK